MEISYFTVSLIYIRNLTFVFVYDSGCIFPYSELSPAGFDV
jgi:hypothetical protein